MESKLNPTVVGAFVLLLGAALVAGVLWLAVGVGGRDHLGILRIQDQFALRFHKFF